MVRGKGRLSKVTRGGGRHFSKHMSMEDGGEKERKALRGEDEDSDEDSEDELKEESSDESSEEEAGASAAAQPELTRAERRELKKKAAEKQKQAEEEDPDLINPNHVQQKMNISDLNTPRELSRREKEQKEKQEAKDRYWKLHVQGKTDEAKADLGRLAKIRAERDAAQAKRKAEAEAKAEEAEAKKKAQLAKRS